MKAITACEIWPRIVIREQAPVTFGYRPNRFLYCAVERLELLQERNRICFIGALIVEIEVNQLVANQSSVTHGVLRVEPQVRIWMAMLFGKTEIVNIFLFADRLLAEKKQRDAFFHIRPRQIQRRNLEIQPIGDEQVRLRK